MGYTHYWDRKSKLNSDKFEKFTEQVSHILSLIDKEGSIGGVWYEGKEVKIANWKGEKDTEACINTASVSFNGEGDNSHESFSIDNSSDDVMNGFSFCKTARKPYDIAVTACLIAFKKCFEYAVKISSDGDYKEWECGLKLYNLSTEEPDLLLLADIDKWLKE